MSMVTNCHVGNSGAFCRGTELYKGLHNLAGADTASVYIYVGAGNALTRSDRSCQNLKEV